MDIEKLYREYFTPVYRYALSLVHDPDLAEEITQETFFRALRKIDDYRGEASLKVWLCQIAKNLCFDSAKRQAKMTPLMMQGEDDAASCYEIPAGSESSVNVNLILYKKWKIILYNFQLFAGWFSRNARLSFSLYDGPLMETTDE